MLFNIVLTSKETDAYIPPIEKRMPTEGGDYVGIRRNLKELTYFDPELISSSDYDEYMNFVESLWGHQGRGLLQERFSMDQALEVLHKANYSLPRAKFYLQFPILYQIELHKDKAEESKIS